MVGVVVALFLAFAFALPPSADVSSYILNTMSATGTAISSEEFSFVWAKVLSDENHTLVPVNGSDFVFCNASHQHVFDVHDADG
jgi:hypothetical protein